MRVSEKRKFGATFSFRAFDANGNLKWQDVAHNLVTEAGLNYMLEAALGDNVTENTFYAGLTDGDPTVDESDTLSSNPGWNEVDAYAGDRKEWQAGSATSKQIDNSANLATFEINTDGTTVGGGFLTAAETGTDGLLLNVAPLQGGDRVLSDGDTLELEVRFTAANQ